jgi:hypothetical protein
MNEVPMLADVGVRLAFGLALLLLTISWRSVPLPFFRTHCQIILALLVLAALDASRAFGMDPRVVILVAGALLAYVATVTWGLGLPRVARPATILIVVAAGAWLAMVSRMPEPLPWVFHAASRYASGFLLGASFTAMLLGHHYLTAPAMSIEPLKQFVRCIGWGLALRGLVALIGLALARSDSHAGLAAGTLQSGSELFLLMRWGMGYLGPIVATVLAWKTVQIRSTQSATGILYIATTLVLFGELTSLIGALGRALFS